MDGNRLKELCRASGGSCGGTAVDAEYFQMFTNILGKRIIQSLKQEKPEAYLDLQRTFETVKRTVTSSKSGKVNMSLPYLTLDELCREHVGKDLKTTLSTSKYGDAVSIGGDKIRIDADLFKTFFRKTIKDIISLLQEVLSRKESKYVSHILLVGGFSECFLVQDAIKKEFKNFRVVVPYESGLAVLKGAVLFGHNPEFIGSRKSRFSYGIATDPLFDPDVHDEQHGEVMNGEKRCKNWFDVIMIRNTLVPSGTKITRTYVSKLNFKTIGVKLFTTEDDQPIYTDDEGCTLLGKVIIDIPDLSRIHTIDVDIIFGNTELKLEVTEKSSNKKYNASFTLI